MRGPKQPRTNIAEAKARMTKSRPAWWKMKLIPCFMSHQMRDRGEVCGASPTSATAGRATPVSELTGDPGRGAPGSVAPEAFAGRMKGTEAIRQAEPTKLAASA